MEKSKRILTLALAVKDNQILLAMKKRGFGAGMWNGFGGKLNTDETIEQALIREALEEGNINLTKYELAGRLEFDAEKFNEIQQVHIYRVDEFTGEPQESEEMKPQWFALDKIPYAEMWPDDSYWLPLFLAGKKFVGHFSFGENNQVLDYGLKEVDELNEQ